MFHRVKSENQETADAPKVGAEAADVKAQGADINTDADMDSENKTAAPETAQESTLYNSQEKDIKNMTDQGKKIAEQEETAPTAPGAYQRPGQPPVRGAGYPGAYPGIGAGASDLASESDRRLTIGRGITMSGEIEACDYLLVEGTVEAALKGANILEIAESGVFYGTVEINEANIAGRFEGDITVNGRLTITATGTVTGSISYKEIEIEAGAVLDGKLTPLSAASVAPAKKPQAAAPKAAKPPSAPKSAEKQPEPANTEEGLFSKAAAAAE